MTVYEDTYGIREYTQWGSAQTSTSIENWCTLNYQGIHCDNSIDVESVF